MNVRDTVQHEPVRLSGYTALAVGAVLVAAFLWSTGADLRQIVGTLALVGLTSIPGLEWARSHVAPAPTAARRNLEEQVPDNSSDR